MTGDGKSEIGLSQEQALLRRNVSEALLFSYSNGGDLPSYLCSPAWEVSSERGTPADLEGRLFSEETIRERPVDELPTKAMLITNLRRRARRWLSQRELDKFVGDEADWPIILERTLKQLAEKAKLPDHHTRAFADEIYIVTILAQLVEPTLHR
jgi:hypothetical protein